MKRLFAMLGCLVLLLATVNVKEPYYVNNNMVCIPKSQYVKLLNMGFNSEEIADFSKEKYKLFSSYQLIGSITRVKQTSVDSPTDDIYDKGLNRKKAEYTLSNLNPVQAL